MSLLGSGSCSLSSELLLFDTSLLTGQAAEVEYTGATYFTVLVDFDILDER